jgi:hypothetical protein
VTDQSATASVAARQGVKDDGARPLRVTKADLGRDVLVAAVLFVAVLVATAIDPDAGEVSVVLALVAGGLLVGFLRRRFSSESGR